MDEPSHLATDEDVPDLELTRGRIEYDDVSFSYDGEADDEDNEPVIEEIDFTVDAGETLALVGPTGAGKSTVLKLLPRLYDISESTDSGSSSPECTEGDGVDSGAVRIDGQDVREVDPGSLRRAIGYVGQETFLFFGSVADNIRYGSFDADFEEVVAAAKAARAHEFIQDLEDGYDTEVGERWPPESLTPRSPTSVL